MDFSFNPVNGTRAIVKASTTLVKVPKPFCQRPCDSHTVHGARTERTGARKLDSKLLHLVVPRDGWRRAGRRWREATAALVNHLAVSRGLRGRVEEARANAEARARTTLMSRTVQWKSRQYNIHNKLSVARMSTGPARTEWPVHGGQCMVASACRFQNMTSARTRFQSVFLNHLHFVASEMVWCAVRSVWLRSARQVASAPATDAIDEAVLRGRFLDSLPGGANDRVSKSRGQSRHALSRQSVRRRRQVSARCVTVMPDSMQIRYMLWYSDTRRIDVTARLT